MKTSTFLLLLALFVFGLQNSALGSGYSTFRCGPELVSIGDTKEKVLATCGQPTSREVTGEQATGTYKGTGDDRQGETAGPGGTYTRETKIVEKWIFNCGSGDYIYVLTFVGGTLSSIDSAGRGAGKSDCGGPAR